VEDVLLVKVCVQLKGFLPMNVEQPRVAEALTRRKDRLVKPHP
jgi:hypothetical protein